MIILKHHPSPPPIHVIHYLSEWRFCICISHLCFMMVFHFFRLCIELFEIFAGVELLFRVVLLVMYALEVSAVLYLDCFAIAFTNYCLF